VSDPTNDLSPDFVHPLSLVEWRQWLADHHRTATQVWMVSFKRTTGRPRVEYEEAVEEALCWGWIDSTKKSLDDERSAQRFSPRRAGSDWSQSNKRRLEALMAAGRVSAWALAGIEAAQRDGSWTKIDAAEAREVPDDLRAELARYPDATRWFEGFPSSERRRLLVWLSDAKRPETRAKRVAEIALKAQDNVRANQPKERSQ